MTARLHPLTGRPLEPLGFRLNGRPIWPIMGGSIGAPEGGAAPGGLGAPAPGTAPGQPAAPAPAPGQTPAGPPQGTPAPGQPGAPPPAAPPAQGVVDDDPRAGEDYAAFLARVGPEGAARMALKYRAEAGDRRAELRQEQTKAQQDQAAKERADAALAALRAAGILPPDESETDPQKIAEKLATDKAASDARDQQQLVLQLENAVLRNALAPELVAAFGPAGVNTAALLDSRSFSDTLTKLDPAAADFGAKVVAAMKDAASKNASFRSAPVAPRGGAPLPGGSGERPQSTAPKSLADAVAGSYGQ